MITSKNTNNSLSINRLANSKKNYILYNINEEPAIIPLKNNIVVIQVFDDEEIANKYIEFNKLQGFTKIKELNKDELKDLIELLFFKGLDGVIYTYKDKNSIKNEYLEFTELSKTTVFKNSLIKKEYKKMIDALLKSLYDLKFINYLYDKNKLTPDEALIGIVRYLIRKNGKHNYIDLFETYSIAENYCKKKHFIINREEKEYCLTTLGNDVFYYSINLLAKKTDNCIVRFHTKNKVLKIKVEDFLKILKLVGFVHFDFGK